MSFLYQPDSDAAANGHGLAIDAVYEIIRGNRCAREQAAQMAKDLAEAIADCAPEAANSMLYGALELLLDMARCAEVRLDRPVTAARRHHDG